MNYTKGEWKVEYPNWTMIAVLTMDEEVGYETYKYIAEVNPCEDGRFLDGEETANAHLIAAAPDMYEALKGLCIAYNMDEHSIILNQDPEYWERTFKALAKAEGREEK